MSRDKILKVLAMAQVVVVLVLFGLLFTSQPAECTDDWDCPIGDPCVTFCPLGPPGCDLECVAKGQLGQRICVPR